MLHLVRRDRHAGGEDLGQPQPIEVGEADVPDLAGAAQLVEPHGGLDVAGHVEVPPVELHEIEPLDLQPGQRSVDAAHDVSARVREAIEVGVAVHLHGGTAAGAPSRQPVAIAVSTPV